MRAALAMLLVPAFAAAGPTFSTSISADAPFADGVTAVRTKLDACWRAQTTVKLNVTVTAGAVKTIELVEVDPKAPLPCLTKVLHRIKLDAATNGVFELTLRGSAIENLLLKNNVRVPLSTISGIGTGPGTLSGVGGIVSGRRTTGGGTTSKDVKIAFETSGSATVEIDRVVRSRAGVFRACYQKELQRTPNLAGRITIKFAVAADGTVRSASVASTTMNDARVEDCVRSNVVRLRFPASVGPTEISYPFAFSQG